MSVEEIVKIQTTYSSFLFISLEISHIFACKGCGKLDAQTKSHHYTISNPLNYRRYEMSSVARSAGGLLLHVMFYYKIGWMLTLHYMMGRHWHFDKGAVFENIFIEQIPRM